ncbi:MAG: elongation factor P [Bdellovibrionales bacterium]|nr:elongation factor P [Bdellovibrionales bacterium]
MIGSKQLKVGMVILFKEELWKVMEAVHTSPGKGAAFVQAKLRNLKKGTQTEHKFRSSENVERVLLDTRPVEYLYQEGENYIFMDTESYEQFQISAEMLEGKIEYLRPNLQLMLESHQETPIGIELPKTVQVKIVECEPYIKTATATNTFKQATTDTGANVLIPGFIEQDELVEIDTETGKYVSRVKA